MNLTQTTSLTGHQPNELGHWRLSISDRQTASFVLRALYFDESSGPNSN